MKQNGTTIFGTPLLDFSSIGISGREQVLARTRQGFEKIKAASAGMAQALCETHSSSTKSATDYGLKVLEFSNANTASAFDFMIDLCSSKSATDVFKLSGEQTRKALDAASRQNRELWALTQKLAIETGEPVRKLFTKVLHQAG